MRKKVLIVSVIVLGLTVAAMGFAGAGLSQGLASLSTEISRSQVDAILASADIEDEAVVTAPILYYEQVADECADLYGSSAAVAARQFEWGSCGYYNNAFETGLVAGTLDNEYLPVAVGGELLANRGLVDGFSRWFSRVEGVSANRAETLTLRYEANTASFKYESDNFQPLGEGKLFTFNLGVPVQVMADGNESFAVTADDDTWVFVGDRLVLDLGGVHPAMTGRFKITEEGEIYTAVGEESLAYSGVKVEGGVGTVVRIFHANRNSGESVFRVSFSNMLLNITGGTTVAGVESDATVAYNPEDPGYAAPLGESLTYQPNRSRTILAAAVGEAVIVGALAVILVAVISVVWRYARGDRSREE